MSEVFPLLTGLLIGFLIHQLTNLPRKGLVLLVLAICFGATASYISGELFISWAYLLFDTAQVLVIAILTAISFARWQVRTWL